MPGSRSVNAASSRAQHAPERRLPGGRVPPHCSASPLRHVCVCVLVDFRAAFPSIAHTWLFESLRAAGLPRWPCRCFGPFMQTGDVCSPFAVSTCRALPCRRVLGRDALCPRSSSRGRWIPCSGASTACCLLTTNTRRSRMILGLSSRTRSHTSLRVQQFWQSTDVSRAWR